MKASKKQRKSPKNFFYFFILFLIFFIFVVLVFLNLEIKKQLSEISVNIIPLTFNSEEYPIINDKEAPLISGKGAVVIDNDSKVPVYVKNPNLRFIPASTTKIMTALVALDHYRDDDILIINETNVGETISDFQKGEKFRFEDILYAMLLPSNNDATLAIAQNYPGGEKEFVRKMNEKAKEFSLNNTKFIDPIGLEDGNYITPIDLARLTSFAIENPKFTEVVSTRSREIESIDGNIYFMSNLNELLDVPGVNGVKTGFTKAAGEVLVTSRKLDEENKELIFVVMRSEDRFNDTRLLIDYLNDITYQSISP